MSGVSVKLEKRPNKKKRRKRNASKSARLRKSSDNSRVRSGKLEMSSVERMLPDESTCSRRLFSTKHALKKPYLLQRQPPRPSKGRLRPRPMQRTGSRRLSRKRWKSR